MSFSYQFRDDAHHFHVEASDHRRNHTIQISANFPHDLLLNTAHPHMEAIVADMLDLALAVHIRIRLTRLFQTYVKEWHLILGDVHNSLDLQPIF